MKALILILILILLGFITVDYSMDYDEYTERVKYCEQRGLKASVTWAHSDGRVVVVSCFNDQGVKFKSGIDNHE